MRSEIAIEQILSNAEAKLLAYEAYATVTVGQSKLGQKETLSAPKQSTKIAATCHAEQILSAILAILDRASLQGEAQVLVKSVALDIRRQILPELCHSDNMH